MDKRGNEPVFNENEIGTVKSPVKIFQNPYIVSSSRPRLFLCSKYCYFLGAHLHKKDGFNVIKAKPDHGWWGRMELTPLSVQELGQDTLPVVVLLGGYHKVIP